jgi:hypothetical protein
LALAICAALFVSHLVRALRSDKAPRVGDGKNVATYGFTLSPCLIPCDEIVAAGLPKDGLPALMMPRLMSAAAVDSLNQAERGKYLVSDDRVIGLVIAGMARAYPLRVLNWHEVANDTLGGQPVAVTYNPLCDASAGFSRRVTGQELEFGVSGLLYNSNLLLYDRREDGHDESLWSQLQARAVTGPAAAAGRELTVLPIAVVSWADWCSWHPHTTVPYPEQEFRASYKRNPYGSYYGSDRLRFPVRPQAPVDGLRPKERIVALYSAQKWLVYPYREIRARSQGRGVWVHRQGDVDLRFVCSNEPPGLAVFTAETSKLLPSVHTFWFAWFALHPQAALAIEPGASF